MSDKSTSEDGGHGRSDALAVENAVGMAITAVEGQLIETIRQDIQDAMTVLASTPQQR